MLERAISLIILTFLSLFLGVMTLTCRHTLYQFFFILILMVIQGVLYLYLNSEFLAAFQVIVYAGAILVMFLFSVFLFTDDDLRGSTIQARKLSYISFIPLGVFLALLLIKLFKNVTGNYAIQIVSFDLKILTSLLFNEYWILLYILAFILSLPMIALYIFVKGD